jgi:hypothetical protein
MCIGTTVSKPLFMFTDVTNKCIRFECTAIGKVSINNNAMLKSQLLKGLFGPDGFNSREPKLMFNKKETRAVVNKDTFTFTCGRGCLAKRIKGTFQDVRLKVVHRHIGPRTEVIRFEITKCFCVGYVSTTSCQATMSFCIFAGGTFEVVSVTLRGCFKSRRQKRQSPKNLLNGRHIEMANTIMPLQKELLATSEVLVGRISQGNVGLRLR